MPTATPSIPLPQVAPDHGHHAFASGRGGDSPFARYVGDHLAVWAAHASDPADRRHVASGGVVTTLLATALRDGVVDGVAVCRVDFSEGKLGHRFEVVTDPDAVQDFGTSAYFNVPIERYSKQIDAFDGRVALCALPCHTGILRRRQANGRELSNLALYVSLFCGHNNEPELLRFVFAKAGVDESQIADMRVDRTYLGGALRLAMRDGSERPILFRHFNVYRSLWFFSKQMCRYCDDHLGSGGDLSIGDVFTPEYRSRGVKHSAVIARTEAGRSLVESAIGQGRLTAESIDPSVVFRAQKRVIVPSGDLRSRYRACRTVGFSAKPPPEGRFRLRSYLTYTALLANERLSQASWGPAVIRHIPRPLLYAYVAGIKLVNNTLRP